MYIIILHITDPFVLGKVEYAPVLNGDGDMRIFNTRQQADDYAALYRGAIVCNLVSPDGDLMLDKVDEYINRTCNFRKVAEFRHDVKQFYSYKQ